MTLFKTIIAITVPALIAIFFMVLFIIECVVSRQMQKPVCRKQYKFSLAEPTDYIVVCPNLKRADYWCKRLWEYLNTADIPCRLLCSGSARFIDIMGSHQMIRFTSERKYDEISVGLHNAWVVEENQVEEWLEAAEVSDE